MDAGREMDALIAEKVMEMGSQWTVQQQPDGTFTPTGEVWYDCPEFSTDIHDAWQVVDKIGQTFNVTVNALHDWIEQYECSIWPPDTNGDISYISANAPTASLAICRAALLTVEKA